MRILYYHIIWYWYPRASKLNSFSKLHLIKVISSRSGTNNNVVLWYGDPHERDPERRRKLGFHAFEQFVRNEVAPYIRERMDLTRPPLWLAGFPAFRL